MHWLLLIFVIAVLPLNALASEPLLVEDGKATPAFAYVTCDPAADYFSIDGVGMSEGYDPPYNNMDVNKDTIGGKRTTGFIPQSTEGKNNIIDTKHIICKLPSAIIDLGYSSYYRDQPPHQGWGTIHIEIEYAGKPLVKDLPIVDIDSDYSFYSQYIRYENRKWEMKPCVDSGISQCVMLNLPTEKPITYDSLYKIFQKKIEADQEETRQYVRERLNLNPTD